MPLGSGRQLRVVVNDRRVSALPFDHPPEHVDAGTRRDRVAHQPLGPDAVGDVGEHDHPRRQPHREVLERARTASLERLDRLDDFERVADRTAERRVHRRDQRFGPHPGTRPDRDQRLGETTRVPGRLHERAGAGLDVEHERVDPLGDLLAHDRRRDEGDALDGGRDVAERVQPFVGRCDLGGLADQAAADLGQHPLELAEEERCAKPGNRLELVERAARVAERAPGHHRHDHAARRRERGQDEGGLVSHAARTVFVDLEARQVPEIHAHTRIDHRFGQRRRLVGRHALEHDGHQERRCLVVRPRSVGDAADEELNLVAGQCSPIALAGDQVNGSHGLAEYSGLRAAVGAAEARPYRFAAAAPVGRTFRSGGHWKLTFLVCLGLWSRSLVFGLRSLVLCRSSLVAGP